jgi:hypothetical protein
MRINGQIEMKLSVAPWLAILALGAVATAPAFGQSALTGPSTVISPQAGSPLANGKSTSGSPCPDTYQFAPSTGTTTTNVTASPTTTYTFADTFNQTKGTSTFSDFGAAVYTSGPKCPGNPNCLGSSPFLTWNFQDNYDFTTPLNGPQVQGAVLSFSIPSIPGGGIGVENVEARIIAFDPTKQAPGQLLSTNLVTVVDGWQSAKTGGTVNLYTATLNSTTLAANTEYVLQIRGEALNSGSYSGSVTFTPVPVPASMLLLLSGLLGVVMLRYRPTALGPMGSAVTC